MEWVGQSWEEGVVVHYPRIHLRLVHPPQAIHMETDPQTISAYLIYLSQHTPVEEQGPHSDLALVREFWQGQMALSPVLWLAIGLEAKEEVEEVGLLMARIFGASDSSCPYSGCGPTGRGTLHHHGAPLLKAFL